MSLFSASSAAFSALRSPSTAGRRVFAVGATTIGAATLALSAVSGQAQAQPLAAQDPAAGSAGGAKQTAQKVIGDETQYTCFSQIVGRESGWDHTAQDESSGAYGLVQALPADKMASAGGDWKTNPTTQIQWGVNYMNERYGSPCAAWEFWQQNNWY